MKYQKGQTLIEMLLAIVVASFLLVALTAIILTTFTNINNNQNDSTALQFAQSGMEYMKSQAQQNPIFLSNLASKGANFCLGSTSTTESAHGPTPTPDSNGITNPLQQCPSSSIPASYLLVDSIGQLYLRQVNITAGGNPCVSGGVYTNYLVEVSVGWHDNKCSPSSSSNSNYFCRITKLDTCISNTNALPTLGF